MHFANLKVVLSKVTRFFPSIVLSCIASLYIYSSLLSQYLHTWSLGVFWASTFSWRIETFQASYIIRVCLKLWHWELLLNYSDEYHQGVNNVCALPNNPGIQKYARLVDLQKQPGTSLEGNKNGIYVVRIKSLGNDFLFIVL